MSNSKPEPAVGIDLGTTYSVVAHLDAHSRPCTIWNSEGDPLTASVVLFDDDATIVGKEAQKAAIAEPDRVAQFAKRDIGNDFYSRPIKGKRIPPEVIQSCVLKRLKEDAEVKVGPFEKVVITVPAFFNEPRRKATQDAGALAGLKVLDIINEPTAAAIAYGVQEGFLSTRGKSHQLERVLVYDLGGGTFDVTLMEIRGGDYKCVATDGDVQLGGIDWDQRIVDYVAKNYMKKGGPGDPRKDPSALQRLLREAEDTKRALSVRDKTTLTFENKGESVRVPLTREKFEELTADLVDRTRFTVNNVLRDAGCEWSDVTRVLLVGGSSRMPMVQEMLEKEWGKPVKRSVSADEAVAHGAAIYAGILLKQESSVAPNLQVRNVSSHDLGVLGIEEETGRPINRVLIPRNTVLPVRKAGKFKTFKNNQESIAIKIVEGGDASGNNSTLIGKCVVRDLPSGLPAGTPVEVCFAYAANNRIKVSARIPHLDQTTSMVIERATGLSKAHLGEWSERLRKSAGLSGLG